LQVIKNSLPAMASSGKGTNGPTDAEDDKFEELLAAPGCCSGWQGQAKNNGIFLIVTKIVGTYCEKKLF
jgi:hypothetical protein